MVTYWIPYLIPGLPFLSFVINIFWGKRLGVKSAAVTLAASSVSCLIALNVIRIVTQGHTLTHEFPWLMLGDYALNFGYLIDPLAATLLFVVTVVGTLIQIYSVGYMHGDKRFSRFFAYVSLFMFAMLMLVIADNFILFFMSWEIVGLCSYFLIGFWFEKPSAADASKKAFLTTRIGDVGFLLGLLTLFAALGTFEFSKLGAAVHTHWDHPLLPLAAGLIFCGAVGKSAQFPLHVWLPDAMEGPTPVSALIHAATMVAAGVYLLARSFVLFEATPEISMVVSIIGTLTAFMAAYIALTATDIKRVLAFSTISQLGYMVAAVGLGGLTASIFHLMTHAFFKALLFLCAGSVIHGTGTQDLRAMGGLFGKMKSTAWTFLIGSLAISGVPPLAGFWSKDEILAQAHHAGYPVLYFVLVLTAFMTAFYMFRLFFMTFMGKPRNPEIHAHESPKVMTIPLWILAFGAACLGLVGSPWLHNGFQNFLQGAHHAAAHKINMPVMILSILLGLAGILLAALLYPRNLKFADQLANLFRPFYLVSFHKFWMDEFYGAYVVRPFHALGRRLFRFDQTVIDGFVNLTGLNTLRGSDLHHWFDRVVIDGLVNFAGAVTQFASAFTRRIQTGLVQNYLLLAVAGVFTLLFFGLK